MDKTAIKNFAVRARRNLIQAIAQKAFEYGITETEAKAVETVQGGFRYDGNTYTTKELDQRNKLIETLKQKSGSLGYAHGYKQVMEEVAYTWFNRFIALRFMEINEYLPSGVRVLSSLDEGKVEPDIIREALNLDFVDKETVYVYQDANNIHGLYKYLLIKQCNELSKILPGMFEKIENYTELLLPDHLFSEGSVVRDLVDSIDEQDFKDAVEIIGWLYQYYISEKKAEVFAGLAKNIKITKENIPAATQLFTPEWIVRYMVENSLGRLWLEYSAPSMSCGNAQDALRKLWTYYIDEADQEDAVEEQLHSLRNSNTIDDPTKIKIIDPCMGSGHVLVYAFDVLYQIYFSLGYLEREIPKLILTQNIYGFDIDDRAAQLAYFALMMKARSYNRRFFRDDNVPEPHVYSIVDSSEVNKNQLKFMGDNIKDKDEWNETYNDLCYIVDLFADAKEFGSIINCDKMINFKKAYEFRGNYLQSDLDLDTVGIDKASVILFNLIEQYAVLNQKYDVVITNPPYMSPTPAQADFVKKNFPDSKTDLFAIFIEKCGQMLKPNSYQAMITMHSWMFLSSYEKLRKKLLSKDIINMAHLGARAFEEIGGEVVQTTAFVLRNTNIKNYNSTFVRLVNYNSQRAKEQAFLSAKSTHTAQKENFQKIPGIPIAYWMSENAIKNFSMIVGEKFKANAGISTGDNEYFIHFWHEVDFNTIRFSNNETFKFVPHIKGGDFRRWYGNRDRVLMYTTSAIQKMERLKGFRHDGHNYYYKCLISWSKITSSQFSIREYEEDVFAFDSAAPAIALDKPNLYLLALLNSKVTSHYLTLINPTLNFPPGYIHSVPYIENENGEDYIKELVKNNISTSKTDWDSYEASWDFKQHPFITYKSGSGYSDVPMDKWQYKIQDAFDSWENNTNEAFKLLKANEEELNRIFIEIYNLQDELTPEVEDKDITINKADKLKDIKSFISYAVGCMLGRYSLDTEGLAYAGGEWDDSKYKTFIPDKDNILPINENDYFEDDIIARFIDFVKITFGEETLEQNLNFIASALYPNSSATARQSIRKYFVSDFYKDHVQIYKKRPIYWLFDSGKAGGFKALIYMHRYDAYTAARVRTDYLHPLQRKYDAEMHRLDMAITDESTSALEKASSRKLKDDLLKKHQECLSYDQVIAHIAHQQIEIDLDDGVVVNYAKFQNVEVPQGEGKAALKMNLLAKI